jgi:putative lipoprotein (rSAM/lipoprotein system)
MKLKIKKQWFAFQNKSIRYLLSFLGIGSAVIFNGCMYGSPVVEYGTPSAVFKVTGKVTSKAGEDIQGIKVIVNSSGVTRTDGSGIYKTDISDFPKDQEYKVQFMDDDGSQNGGEFVALDTVVKFTDPKFEGGDGDWFSGFTSKELNVKLEKKN